MPVLIPTFINICGLEGLCLASHWQVPMDQARAGLDMITRFTRNKPLAPPSARQGLLPGATWKLRRAMPGGGAQLSAGLEE
jgi:hypothetical protein